jgi:ribosomal protein S16
MSVKIRLQRHGKKGKPFYWIVADARSKRDGKFLEKLGTYNPNTNPATIDLNLDKQFNGYTMVLNQLILLEQFFLTKVLY